MLQEALWRPSSTHSELHPTIYTRLARAGAWRQHATSTVASAWRMARREASSLVNEKGYGGDGHVASFLRSEICASIWRRQQARVQRTPLSFCGRITQMVLHPGHTSQEQKGCVKVRGEAILSVVNRCS